MTDVKGPRHERPARLLRPLLLGLTAGVLTPLILLTSELLNFTLGLDAALTVPLSWRALQVLHPVLPGAVILTLLWGAYRRGRRHHTPARAAALHGGLLLGLLLWYLTPLHLPGPLTWTAAAGLLTLASAACYAAGTTRRI